MKRATKRYFCMTNAQKISIHALMKRATFVMINSIFVPSDFNPRPHEEGDLSPVLIVCSEKLISIHALMKRATVQNDPRYSNIVISIHALMKRATSGSESV